jgi:baseplate hub protein gp41
VGELFRRRYVLTVDTLRITDLDVSFRVKRTLKREPNTCDVALYNLRADHRRQLAEKPAVRVVLEAGYEGSGLSAIFRGDLRSAHTQREGPDLVTRVSSGDGERRARGTRVSRTFGPGTPLRAVLMQAAEDLGLGLGNLAQAAAAARLEGGGNTYAQGTTLHGPAYRELCRLLESCGLECSVQNGALQVLERGRALGASAVVLSPETGLVESPSEASDGVVTAKALMVPDLVPGRVVEFRAREVEGFYRVSTGNYQGDTTGGEWGVTVECAPMAT